jgi:toxin-antitoxin system PIN domain toxin
VILIDANLLLYAYNPSFQQHEPARRWLEDVLSGTDPVRFAWATLLAFLRISTNPRAFEHPFTAEESVPIVSAWLERPNVAILDPGERYWSILRELLVAHQVRGPAVMDAHLAALAIEHGAVLHTTDRGFSRYPGVRLRNPIQS